jgi:hypothetical protein
MPSPLSRLGSGASRDAIAASRLGWGCMRLILAAIVILVGWSVVDAVRTD